MTRDAMISHLILSGWTPEGVMLLWWAGEEGWEDLVPDGDILGLQDWQEVSDAQLASACKER